MISRKQNKTIQKNLASDKRLENFHFPSNKHKKVFHVHGTNSSDFRFVQSFPSVSSPTNYTMALTTRRTWVVPKIFKTKTSSEDIRYGATKKERNRRESHIWSPCGHISSFFLDTTKKKELADMREQVSCEIAFSKVIPFPNCSYPVRKTREKVNCEIELLQHTFNHLDISKRSI